MTSLRLVRRQEYKLLQWKNGKGATEEIAIDPIGEDFNRGTFYWRISSAPVKEDTTFSLFPEHDRVLVILTGNGVRLNGTVIRPLEPHAFSGADQSHCELIDGPVQDLSVFTRKGRTQTQVDVVSDFDRLDWSPQGQWEFFFIVRGELTAVVDGEKIVARECDTLAWFANSGTTALTATTDTVVLRIHLNSIS